MSNQAPLKLKGGLTLGGVKKKKKSKSTDLAAPDALEDKPNAELKQAIEGYSLEGQQVQDRRTETERKHEERLRKLEIERLKKIAGKSHKEKVKEFNDKLASLSEHHDIPKVGPG